MSSQLETLPVACDAPPYAVVAACAKAGFHAPLDVRWCSLRRSPARRRGLLGILASNLLGRPRREVRSCGCGQALPNVDRFTAVIGPTFIADYLMVQCPRCRTIYWQELR